MWFGSSKTDILDMTVEFGLDWLKFEEMDATFTW